MWAVKAPRVIFAEVAGHECINRLAGAYKEAPLNAELNG